MDSNSMSLAQCATQLLSIEGKVAIVTGAASGIGRGIALRLAQFGATVVVLDINEGGGKAVAEEIVSHNGSALFCKCDVANAKECHAAVAYVIGKLRRIDTLCNCAGIAIRKDVVELSEEEWDWALDATLKSVYLLSHEVVPHMIRSGGGSIINIGSGWSLKGGPRAASYCAAKGGVVNLTRAMAIDHGKHNIRVNCVCPGDVVTPMLLSESEQLGEDREAFLRQAAHRPLGRVGTPDDVANAVLFLASPMASWITGASLVVDGGGMA
jgi:NAD(P)-dependent dehydrogenase (short-subunit alcohol dehydrogenase family)